jgi:hypothetical protein
MRGRRFGAEWGAAVFSMLKRKGVSLTELMIAVTILTIGVIGGMGSFKYINKAMTQSRIKTIATNLAQEKMEVLKNKSYFQLLVTTASANSTGYSPNFPYDTETYPPQTITLWGMPALTRVVNVDYVTLNGSVPTLLPYTADDPGMKKITVTVMWNDAGTPKKVQFSSYYENPSAEVLSAGFRGVITNASGGAFIGDALVQVQGAPKWRAYSDAAGAYSFQVAPGTYTLVTSSDVYFSTMSPTLAVAAGAYTTYNISLTKIATGSISGMAYLRDHPVIYMVVASSGLVTGDELEFISLYNPTTAQINLLTNPAVSTSNNLKVSYYGESGAGDDVPEFWLQHRSTFIPAGYHYLIASTGTFVYKGTAVTADAVYSPALATDCDTVGAQYSCIRRDKAGAIRITDVNGVPLDTLGWSNTGAGKAAPYYEGTAYALAGGFPEGAQMFRYTSSGSGGEYTGSCYDTNQNNSNFFYFAAPAFRTMNRASGYKAPVSGTPAAGGIVTSNDGLSSSALVSATGYFFLTNVATCAVQNVISTWTVTVASYTVFNSSAGIYVTANQNKDVGNIILSTSVPGGIAIGYVFGSGPDQFRRLGSPTIKVGAGGVTANTDSQGFYMLFLGTGLVTITANYGSANGSYQSMDVEVDVPLGGIVEVPEFHISQGGYLTGYVTSGTGVLPNVVVQATNGGPVFEDTSDSTGHFYIYATTSSVAYAVSPVLDPLQSYTSLPATPLSVSMTIPGSTVFAGTITVVGALGTITGTVVASTASITTGVLVVASTAAVSDPMPAITAANSASQAIYYSVSSQADGTYTLEVRSSTSSTYNMRAFYPLVNANTGAVTYTSRTSTGVAVSAGGTATRNFAW